jgi:DNA-binding PadR family transcriptional regulator
MGFMEKESKPVARLSHSLTYGNIWLPILSLMKKGKVYAYVLPEGIREKFGFTPSKLMAYFVLYKLEDEKLIISKFEGRRKYYELTFKGRKSLEKGKRLLMALSKKL